MSRKTIAVVGLVMILSVIWVLPQITQANDQASQVEQNKLIIRSAIDALWNGEDLGAVDTFYATSFYTHSPDKRITTLWSPAEWKRVTFENLHAQYSDLDVAINSIIAEEDRVMVDFTARGTHDGDSTVDCTVCKEMTGLHWYRNMRTIPATNTRDVWDGVLMYRLENGKIAEEWWYWNGDIAYR